MNISGIRPNQGFYDYNYIKLNELRSQQIASAMQQKPLDVPQEPVVEVVQEKPVEQKYNSFNYAKEYNPNETFELVGADSDIHSLDVQKAVSDLDKDQVLRQYQFFVNDNGVTGVIAKEKDPSEIFLRSGENFML